jgi:CBS domain-containing protein
MDAKKLRARDIMQAGVKTIRRDAPLLAAVKTMIDHEVSSLVVEPEEDGDTFGIITRKDIVEALMAEGEEGISLLVEDVMTNPAITANVNLSISSCHRLMRMVGVRRLPVVNGTDLVGILSNEDIFETLVKDMT